MSGVTSAEFAQLRDLAADGPAIEFSDEATEETLWALVAQGRAVHWIENETEEGWWDRFGITAAGRAAMALYLTSLERAAA